MRAGRGQLNILDHFRHMLLESVDVMRVALLLCFQQARPTTGLKSRKGYKRTLKEAISRV